MDKEHKMIQEGIRLHAENLRIKNSDQTEINDGGSRILQLYPTAIQKQIERVITQGTAYVDSIRAPYESQRLSWHLEFKRNYLRIPCWTEKLFDEKYGFKVREIKEYGLQRHLLEMELRTEDEAAKYELEEIQKKHFIKKVDKRGYDYFPLEDKLIRSTKQEVVKHFQELGDTIKCYKTS